MSSPSYSPDLSSCSPSSALSCDSMASDSHGLTYTRKSGKTIQLNNNNESGPPASKSPILVKYNYYDTSGIKMEQTNLDMNFKDATSRIQRQLSPTFRQSLDQIVRNSLSGSPEEGAKRQQMATAEYRQVQLARRYKMSSYEQRCLRCKKTVYQMDKVGPLKDFTFYHQNCFKCRECGTKLTLKTYFNSQLSSGDQEVYCHRHCPKTPAGRLDNLSVGIRAALNAPKVFEAGLSHALADGQLAHEPAGSPLSPSNEWNGAPSVDGRALYIQHAVRQTRLQSIYRESQVDKKISQFISNRLEFLEPKQKLLEMRHREEEDQLFKAFELKWRQEETSISEQIRHEWKLELAKLLDKYKRQLSSISSSQHLVEPRGPPASAASPHPAGEQRMIEFERLNLEKTMTIKLDRKKETLKRKLKEFERQATAELVEKQSREMLALISIKLDEYKEEQKVGCRSAKQIGRSSR